MHGPLAMPVYGCRLNAKTPGDLFGLQMSGDQAQTFALTCGQQFRGACHSRHIGTILHSARRAIGLSVTSVDEASDFSNSDPQTQIKAPTVENGERRPPSTRQMGLLQRAGPFLRSRTAPRYHFGDCTALSVRAQARPYAATHRRTVRMAVGAEEPAPSPRGPHAHLARRRLRRTPRRR